MLRILYLFIALLFLDSCTKTNEPDTILIDLSFISTNTPTIVLQGQDITSDVRCSAANLCYKFSKFEIAELPNRQFEIRAKGTYPNPKKGEVVCLQAIYIKDTTVKINAAAKGQYILKFYNPGGLYRTDTVMVN